MVRKARFAAVAIMIAGGMLISVPSAEATVERPSISHTTVSGVPSHLQSAIPLPPDTQVFTIRNINAFGKCVGISGYLAGDWDCTGLPLDQRWFWGPCYGTAFCQLVNFK